MKDILLVLLLGATIASGQEIDRNAVLRLGNMVHRIDGTVGQTSDDAFLQVMGPPADDAHKWFISVLAMKNCGPCQKLQQEWKTNEWLLSLANPDDPKQSWSHFNLYYREDTSQWWRWEKLKITSFPTIVVQPPGNNRFGPSKLVVYKGPYEGDPKKLATEISNAIRLYLNKLQQAGDLPEQAYEQTDVSPVGIDPPWVPAPRPGPVAPQPYPSPYNPQPVLPLDRIPPVQVEPTVTVSWLPILLTVLAAGFVIVVIVGLIYMLVRFWPRVIPTKSSPVSEDTLQKLLAELQESRATSPPTSTPT